MNLKKLSPSMLFALGLTACDACLTIYDPEETDTDGTSSGTPAPTKAPSNMSPLAPAPPSNHPIITSGNGPCPATTASEPQHTQHRSRCRC